MPLSESGTAIASAEAGANTGILGIAAQSAFNIAVTGALVLGALYLIFRRK